ncbi:phosphatidylinositol 3,4,5-trisphosphate 3-phosphatase TPTE2-like [Perognathus longimembris pacificus]|uniref:phosphatidylinositol 3,4,5-trisphosphate 3-phosphatase TPTE2-like n=1 Tax=Perognathus longimembris pacificus TaxID=214514 RepID=UPI00201855B9|nr:phosphatidylinositol 3,4,5-trisphosphate 3-phosphatase TPTE2-like [Perognathus longimembris pacificus]
MTSDQITANLRTVINEVSKHRALNFGPFVVRAFLLSSMIEGLLLKMDRLLPKEAEAEEKDKESEEVEGDVILTAVDSLVPQDTVDIPLEYRVISLAIGLFFLMDVLLRVYVEGLVSIFRPLRFITLLRLLHLVNQRRHLEQATRRLVSRDRKRFKEEGFDLDLSYITEHIIAMSFPSSGSQSFYRNPIEEVVRFLDTKHCGHYVIYNLCSEESYDPTYFHDMVKGIKIDDHNVPTLEEIIVFSKEVVDWLAKDAENVIAIPCKGGKDNNASISVPLF